MEYEGIDGPRNEKGTKELICIHESGKRPWCACCQVIVTNCIEQTDYARGMQEKAASVAADPSQRQEKP